MKVKIKGTSWTIRLVSELYWKKYEDSNTYALTYATDNKILLRKNYLSKGMILHELLHAYVSGCSLESVTDLSATAMEEICAGILQDHGEEMFNITDKLYKKLNKK